MTQNLARCLMLVAIGVLMPAWTAAQGMAAATVVPQAPDSLVRTLSDGVLEAIKKDPALKSGDVAKLSTLVDEKVLPYVNFEKMTRLAVGRGWRQATPEQRAKLTHEFRTLLVRTYSGAVSQVADHKVELRPFRAAPADTDVLVRTNIVASRGEPIQIDYRLEKAGAAWKIYDISVLGVWLVENYKNSFATEINNGGIEGLIKSLAERNAKAAK